VIVTTGYGGEAEGVEGVDMAAGTKTTIVPVGKGSPRAAASNWVDVVLPVYVDVTVTMG
jgi:hypothetical protein